MSDEHVIPELSETEKSRIAALNSAINELADGLFDGSLSDETLAASASQIRQIQVDHQRWVDAIEPPADAGEFAEALTGVMMRIPDGRGRWISCDRGWYGLIARFDADLSVLDPDYKVSQVKEKFAALTFSATTDNESVRDEFVALIRAAEQASASICESCGAPGSIAREVRTGWWKTLCDACVEASQGTPRAYRRPEDS